MLGTALRELRKLPDGSADLIFVDPPVGSGTTLLGADPLEISESWDEILRVARMNTPILICADARLFTVLMSDMPTLFQYVIYTQDAPGSPIRWVAVFCRTSAKVKLPEDPLLPKV